MKQVKNTKLDLPHTQMIIFYSGHIPDITQREPSGQCFLHSREHYSLRSRVSKLSLKSQVTNGHDRIPKLYLHQQAVGQTWSVGCRLLLASDSVYDVNVVHGSAVRASNCSDKPGRSFTKDFGKVAVLPFWRKVRIRQASSTSKSLLKPGYKRRNRKTE